MTHEYSLPEIRIWSILLIKSDLKWCIHLSRSLLLPWLNLTVLKTNAVNFYIDEYLKVLPFCQITPSKSPRNYWQKKSENNKILFVFHTKVAASNARTDMYGVHFDEGHSDFLLSLS